MDSFIYFIQQVGGDCAVKIGCSKNPQSRLASLMPWSPCKLEILVTAPGDTGTERFLHEMFADQRIHSEWFLPSPRMLSLVAEIKLAGCVPLSTGIMDLSWRGTRREWDSGLPGVLERLGVLRAQLGTALGLSGNTIQAWCYLGVPDWHVQRVIDFAASRGLAITARDLFLPKKDAA